MNFKQLHRRKLNLEAMLRTIGALPDNYQHRAELRGMILFAIQLEKRGQHSEVDRLIEKLDTLVKERQEELKT